MFAHNISGNESLYARVTSSALRGAFFRAPCGDTQKRCGSQTIFASQKFGGYAAVPPAAAVCEPRIGKSGCNIRDLRKCHGR